MAKTTDEVEKFIELRGRGWSFDRIAQELQVSKPVLLGWERQYDGKVAEAKALELQLLLEKYKLMRLERADAYGALLHSALEELRQRGSKVQELSTDKLVSLALTLESRLSKDTEIHLRSPLEEVVYADSGSDIKVD